MNLFELMAKIRLDSSEYESGIKRAINSAKTAGRVITASIGAAATGIGALIKESIDQYAEYEQLVGGVETLFGNASKTIVENAKNAYKNVQMSANQYMQLSTTLSAFLIQGLAKNNKEITSESATATINILDNQYKQQKKIYDETYSDLQYRLYDELEAYQKANSKKLESLRESQAEEIEAYQKATDIKIGLIDKEYDESLKNINREEYEQKKAIDAKIKALENQDKATENAEKKQAENEKKSILERAARIANSDNERKKAQEQLNAYLKELEQEKQKEERKAQIESLKEEKNTLKEKADADRKAAKEKRDEKVNAVKEEETAALKEMKKSHKEQLEAVQEQQSQEYKIISRAKNKQLKAIKESYDEELEALKDNISAKKEALQSGYDDMASMSIPQKAQEEAANLMDVITRSIADNSAKMGTSLNEVMYSYQSLAMGNFRMLDNLKLGYNGTKSELERLISDASQMTDIQKKLNLSVEAGNMDFANIAKAIAVVQEHLGIAGTAQKEAAETIQGSLAGVKSAWNNLLVALSAKNSDAITLDKTIKDFVVSTSTALNTLIPTFERALVGVGELIEKIIPQILSRLPNIVNEVIPSLIKSGANMITAILTGIKNNSKEIMSGVVQIFQILSETILENLPTIIELGGTMLLEFVRGITDSLPEVMPSIIGAFNQIIEMITNPDALNSLLTAAVDLLIALGDALLTNVDVLFDAFIKCQTTLITFITNPENLEKIFALAVRLVIALGTGLIKAIPELIKSSTNVITAIINNIINTDWLSVGNETGKMIWEGMKQAWNTISAWFSGIWDKVKGFFALIPAFFQGIFQSSLDNIITVFTPIVTFFSNLWENVTNTFSTVGTQIAEAIGGAFKTAINAALSVVEGAINLVPNAINGALGAINNLPGVNIPYMSNVQLPRLAKGAVIDKPTQAIIGEAGAEAVVPLENNTQWIDKLAKKLGGKSNNYYFTVNFDGNINSKNDLESLADDLMYIMQDKIERQGAAMG